MVLAHVTNKLSSHVTHLSVQVFKDDWIRSSSGSKLNISSLSASPSSSLLTRTYSSPQQYKASPGTRALQDRPKQERATAQKLTSPFINISPHKISWQLTGQHKQNNDKNIKFVFPRLSFHAFFSFQGNISHLTYIYFEAKRI